MTTEHPSLTGADPLAFLAGDGEMARLMRAHDWAASSLGLPQDWPQSLRVAARLVLNTPHPMLVLWGGALTCLYNDGFRAALGPQLHPAALGNSARGAWAEGWDVIGPPVELVMSGGQSTWHERHAAARWTYSYSPIDDAAFATGVGGVLVICTQTTSLVEADTKLNQSESLLRTIIETTPGLIYVKDVTGRMLIANSAALELIGKPWSEVQGRTDREFLSDPAQGETVMENDRRVLAAGVTQELEEWVGTGTKAPRLFLSTKTPLRDAAGAIAGLVGISVDITARKAMQKELQALNATLEAQVAARTAERDRIWRHAFDLMLVMDFEGVIHASNPAWQATLGYSEDRLVGRNFTEFLYAGDAEPAQAIIELLRSPSVRRMETRHRHYDSSVRSICWSSVCDGNQIYGVGRDVTLERAQEAELARTAEALRQSQKMEAIGQLTGGIAHDFNNMLQGVTSGIALARRRIEAARMEEAAVFLDAAVAAAGRAAALTRRLLAFGRRQPLNPKPVELDSLIAGLEELIERTVGVAITVDFRMRDGCWPVNCDPNQLESALLNLAINARDAMMADGGRLTIATAHVALDEADTRNWEGAAAGDYVCISVTDTGPGMTPDILAHAFEPFFTTKPDGQGTGLGLSQLYGFVRQSGGVVRLDSEVGAGTAVHIYLPRGVPTEGQASPQPAVGHDIPAIDASGATILLVEDEAAVREFAAEALRELGYRVVATRDGPSALTALHAARRDGKFRVDLLVSDVGLPGGLNGRQLADAVRAVFPGLPVLLITGYAGDAIEGAGRLGAGMEILGKPFELKVLAERVRMMIGG